MKKGHGTLYTQDGEKLTEAEFRIVQIQQGHVAGGSNAFEAVIPRGRREEESVMINLMTDESIDPSIAEVVLESDQGDRYEVKIENHAQRMLRGQVKPLP